MNDMFLRKSSVTIKSIALACILLFSTEVSAARKLSSSAKITLLTCSPGQELYSVFGHSALRLVDQEAGVDSVYNYGTFDFEAEGFYIKFARGKLDYILSRQSFAWFHYLYLNENRRISELELLLSDEEKQLLYDLLEENYLPENRTYRYDFFFDNCSTRIKDILRQSCGEDLNFNLEEEHELSFRDQVEKYTAGMPWSLFGISLALGLPYDDQIKKEEIMFLPDELEAGFMSATLGTKKLCGARVEILPMETYRTNSSFFTPFFMGSFLLLIAFIFFVSGKKFSPFIHSLNFFLIGFVGLLVLLLWIATDHQATKVNLDILWLFPLNLFVPFFKSSLSFKHYKSYLMLILLSLVLGIILSITTILPFYYLPFQLAILCFYFNCWRSARLTFPSIT